MMDRPEAVRKPGEKMVFRVSLTEDSTPVSGKKLKWERTGDDGKKQSGEAVSASEPLLIETSIESPGFTRVIVTALGDDGNPIKDEKGKEIKFEGGAGCELGKLESVPEPKDFDAFWARQKEKLAKVPVKATLAEVPSKSPDIQVFDMRIDCAGGKPVSGYLCKPKDAAPKSLPALVSFRGYGVGSASPVPQPGKITLQINAHGIENGREPEYYKKLQDGELKGYAFSKEENSDPEKSYFNGMMLRVMRALEYVKSLPEWDGKNLAVSGGSQGGLQSLTAAGLDSSVTQCVAGKPWCCDLGGVTLGRLKGWRPDWTEALGYYDPVNHAKRIKCETIISSGLGDYVCPPSGLTVLYNNIKAPKKIDYIQGSTHGYDPPNPQKFTLKSSL
jgi:cephalosporin-C deacetylase-like acetyl esterase